jgi:hypothetical protein
MSNKVHNNGSINNHINPNPSAETSAQVDITRVSALKEETSQNEDGFSFNGIKVHGINKSLISHISLQIEVPLEAGKKVIDGPYHKIKLEIKRNTIARILVEASSNEENVLAVQHVKVSCNHNIKIKNPKSLLKPDKNIIDELEDAFANLNFKELELFANQKAIIDGNLKIFH